MSLQDTPNAERVHIGFFGRRNAGKSSLINAVAGQEVSVVSDTPGTTTDPVTKAMELLPMGPVLLQDTPGYDDEGELGALRVRAARRILRRTDIAVLVADARRGMTDCDRELVRCFRQFGIPYVTVFNKADLIEASGEQAAEEGAVYTSALLKEGITQLKEKLSHMELSDQKDRKPLIADLVRPSDRVVLVIPIDKAAPKGRLILPQQMMLRGILDADGIPVCVKEDRLKEVLEIPGIKPSLVITDSQVFSSVAAQVPGDVPLTSFSILMARYKGFLNQAVRGARVIDGLREGDRILVSEGCTHHRQCGDIGTVKIPALLTRHTGKHFVIETSSGPDFPDDLSSFSLIIHCGACMLGEREVRYRMRAAEAAGVPMTNYGTAIAHMNGILERATDVPGLLTR